MKIFFLIFILLTLLTTIVVADVSLEPRKTNPTRIISNNEKNTDLHLSPKYNYPLRVINSVPTKVSALTDVKRKFPKQINPLIFEGY